MIVDAHCHAWTRWPYQPPVRDPAQGGAAQLLAEMDAAGVERAVVICAAIGGNPDNAGDVAAAAAANPDRLIPFPDLDCRWHATHRTGGGVARLDALCARLKPRGLSWYMNEEAPADWLLGEDGRAFLAAIAERRLVLSVAAGPAQAALVAQAAALQPTLPVLVHHLWRVRAGDPAALSAAVAAARVPNIAVKLSGHGYGVADGWDFPLTAMRPVVQALHEAYGPDRLVWGSDWPVSSRFMTYRQALEIVRTYGPGDTPAARAAILGGTMRRVLDGRATP